MHPAAVVIAGESAPVFPPEATKAAADQARAQRRGGPVVRAGCALGRSIGPWSGQAAEGKAGTAHRAPCQGPGMAWGPPECLKSCTRPWQRSPQIRWRPSWCRVWRNKSSPSFMPAVCGLMALAVVQCAACFQERVLSALKDSLPFFPGHLPHTHTHNQVLDE